MELYVLALGPLLLALNATLVVFPIGLHFARLEREERIWREALNPKPSSSTT